MTIAADSYNPPAAIDGNAAQPAAPRPAYAPILAILPGLALTTTIVAAALLARQLPGVATFSPMILAIVIGMAFHNIVGTPAVAKPGITFALKRILRFAIVLLGFQLTLTQIASVGAPGLLIIVTTLAATFAATTWFGRLLGVDRKLTQLIAAGTSICGASAIIATNTVTEAHDEDVAYAVACVTIFGSIAMFSYPLLPGLLHLDARAYGLWSGASIHEIAQVVAAAFQNGQHAGEIGTMVKLARVTLLAPVVLTLGLMARRSAGRDAVKRAAPPLPWFVFGFIALVGLNSVITIPADDKQVIVTVTTFLLSIALAAMGLETDISKLYARGFRPAILGALAFLFVSSFSLLLIKLMG
jgi:uncharacterized integral membrane protein (TIGR00698 family)